MIKIKNPQPDPGCGFFIEHNYRNYEEVYFIIIIIGACYARNFCPIT